SMFLSSARKQLRNVNRSTTTSYKKRGTRFLRVEQLEDRVVPSTLVADKAIYAPGETAVLHLAGLAVGEAAALQVTRTDSGGSPELSPTWLATDGGLGDFDHVADGQITVYFTIPEDVTLATFQITATGTVSRSTAETTIQADDGLDDVLEA